MVKVNENNTVVNILGSCFFLLLTQELVIFITSLHPAVSQALPVV